MTERKKAKRPKLISYRPPVDWEDEIKARIARSGMTTNAFMTVALLGANAPVTRRHSTDTAEVTRLVAAAAALADALRTLAASPDIPRAEVLARLDEVTEIRTVAFLALGRKP